MMELLYDCAKLNKSGIVINGHHFKTVQWTDVIYELNGGVFFGLNGLKYLNIYI